MDQAGYHTHKAVAAAGWSKILFFFFQFTWGLPVNLVGLIVFLYCRRRWSSELFCNSIVTYLPGNRGGLSLGVFLFLSTRHSGEDRALCAHEYGHTVQCLFLGPLYWFVIAIPSVIWCHLFAGYRKKHGVPYDALYCERWATAWGKQWSGM